MFKNLLTPQGQNSNIRFSTFFACSLFPSSIAGTSYPLQTQRSTRKKSNESKKKRSPYEKEIEN